jgi:hypothetical protein
MLANSLFRSSRLGGPQKSELLNCCVRSISVSQNSNLIQWSGLGMSKMMRIIWLPLSAACPGPVPERNADSTGKFRVLGGHFDFCQLFDLRPLLLGLCSSRRLANAFTHVPTLSESPFLVGRKTERRLPIGALFAQLSWLVPVLIQHGHDPDFPRG